jgi:hypothetical protein
MKCTDERSEAAVKVAQERLDAVESMQDRAIEAHQASINQRARAAGSPNERAIPANDKETR